MSQRVEEEHHRQGNSKESEDDYQAVGFPRQVFRGLRLLCEAGHAWSKGPKVYPQVCITEYQLQWSQD